MSRLFDFLLTRRFFYLFSLIVVAQTSLYFFENMQWIMGILWATLIGITLMDLLLLGLLFPRLEYHRERKERMYLGDDNKVSATVTVKSWLPFYWFFEWNEGTPELIPTNKVSKSGRLTKTSTLDYKVRPLERGIFHFGETYFFLRSVLGFVERRFIFRQEDSFMVYPSVIQMKKYELLVFQENKTASGIKRIRRLGTATEFEQIRNYVPGDELKTINWKATGRRNELMVNQYQDEKSQSVYCIVDKSRTMQLEFDGLTLLDHAVNASLVFSNICLLKGDKIGLVTFSDKMGTQLPAERSPGQMKRILDALYNQKTQFKDSNFELLQLSVRQKIKTRSLLLLFTNFENEFALRRALPYLNQLNKKHLLVVVFFQNNALKEMAYQLPTNNVELYSGIVAERMMTLKSRMARELKQYGIQSIITQPQDLSVSVINKYLELKSRGRF